MAELFVLSGIRVQTSASVGVAVAGGSDGSPTSADELLRHADAAMYRAKGVGRAARQLSTVSAAPEQRGLRESE
jgi:GGDEF domain-containing protein